MENFSDQQASDMPNLTPSQQHQRVTFPQRRMSPMEMKKIRVQNSNSTFDPESYFNEKQTKSVCQPHPEIKGQFSIHAINAIPLSHIERVDFPNEVATTTFTPSAANISIEGESASQQGNDKNRSTTQIAGDGLTVTQQETAKNTAQQTGLTYPNSESICLPHCQQASQSSVNIDQMDLVQKDIVTPIISRPPISFLGELKEKITKPSLRTVELKNPTVSSVASPKRQTMFLKQQEDRYNRFRHNMLTHHICEFSTERFEKEILLGRGKFAAVYSVHKQQPIKIRLEDAVQELRIVRKADPENSDNPNVFLKTIFRCLALDEDKNKETTTTERGALKIAQYNGAESSEIFPPVSVIEEFERELLALKDLTHPNIVRLLGYLSKPLSVVMELVEGENLFICLNDVGWQRQNSLKQRASLAMDIVSGLSFMHKRCYMHRDIKVIRTLHCTDSDHHARVPFF